MVCSHMYNMLVQCTRCNKCTKYTVIVMLVKVSHISNKLSLVVEHAFPLKGSGVVLDCIDS